MEFKVNGKKIHFIGVMGISMSALFKLCKKLGAEVSGSDKNKDADKSSLNIIGPVYSGHKDSYIIGCSVVVYSSAIQDNDYELTLARSLNKEIYERGKFLALIAYTNFDKLISVAGTHGKSTTSAMLTELLLRANMEFTAHIGAISNLINSNFIHCGYDYFLTEACEYKRSFTHLKSSIAVILNVDDDHPDCYHTRAELEDAFIEFASKIKPNGYLIMPPCELIKKITITNDVEILTFGITPECHYCAANIKMDSDFKYKYDLIVHGSYVGEIKIGQYGFHNVYNSLAAIAVCDCLNIPYYIYSDGLMNYRGIKRRFEYIGMVNGAKVLLDYAHHPTEIIATITTAREITSGKLIVCFEPHTYSRTKALIDKFATAFVAVDRLILLPTYPAREVEQPEVDDMLFEKIISRDKIRIGNYEKLSHYIESIAIDEDTVILIGAGTIESVANLLFPERFSK